MLLRLNLFVMSLLPGFLVMLHYYLTHPYRNVSYHLPAMSAKCSSRHLVDIYLPNEMDPKKKYPVMVFITGGAWIIGYKMWGALMGRALCPHGVILCIPDYRNFPQANVTEMMFDIDMAIQWVRSNIGEWGGDRDNILLVGQSAGAHLGSMICLTKAAAVARAESLKMVNSFSFSACNSGEDFDLSIERKMSDEDMTSLGGLHSRTSSLPQARVRGFTSQPSGLWKPTDLAGFIPISGVYNLVELTEHFNQRGLDRRILDWIFENALEKYSPTIFASQLAESQRILTRYFPPTAIIHGANDASAPCKNGIDFHAALNALKIDADLLIYDNMTHTDPILEKPFAGEQQLHKDIYILFRKWGGRRHNFEEFDESIGPCRRVAPQFCIELARMCNPF